MRFADPGVLVLLVLPAVWPLLALWSGARRRRRLEAFAAGATAAARLGREVSAARRRARGALLWTAAALLILAAARPQWGVELLPVTERGADVVLAMDTSLSMAAEDVPPNRLRHSIHSAQQLLDRLAGQRVGLVSFAGEAAVVCPLTVDVGAVRLFLDALDVDAAPAPGTALADALERAAVLLDRGSPDPVEGSRAIVVYSDGEDHEGGLDGALEKLEERGIPVFVVGVGTPGGSPIPLRDRQGNLREYKKDREGRVVTTRLVEPLLERVARATGGRYVRATPAEDEVPVLAAAVEGLVDRELGTQVRRRYRERAAWFLLPALLLLAGEAWLADGRRQEEAG